MRGKWRGKPAFADGASNIAWTARKLLFLGESGCSGAAARSSCPQARGLFAVSAGTVKIPWSQLPATILGTEWLRELEPLADLAEGGERFKRGAGLLLNPVSWNCSCSESTLVRSEQHRNIGRWPHSAREGTTGPHPSLSELHARRVHTRRALNAQSVAWRASSP